MHQHSAELEVDFWEHLEFLDPAEAGPSALITPEAIRSQACHVTLELRPANVDGDAEADVPVRKVWGTIGLTKVWF